MQVQTEEKEFGLLVEALERLWLLAPRCAHVFLGVDH
jgi:hypothetical protein